MAVGDIHGCVDQLNEIIELSKPYPEHKFVFLGDYIDRGPDSEGVINRLKELDAVFLVGNHEEMLLERNLNMKGGAFEDLFVNTKLSQNSLSWLQKATIDKYETESYIFVHAGLNKKKRLEDQNTRDYIWTNEDSDYYSLTGKEVIHGHTVVDEPKIVGNRLNINTGCGSLGYLSAVVLPDMVFLKSSASPGVEHDWHKIRMQLEEEMALYDSFGTLEELVD